MNTGDRIFRPSFAGSALARWDAASLVRYSFFNPAGGGRDKHRTSSRFGGPDYRSSMAARVVIALAHGHRGAYRVMAGSGQREA